MVEGKVVGAYIFYISLSIILVGSIAAYGLIKNASITGQVVADTVTINDSVGNPNDINSVYASVIVAILFFASVLCISHIGAGIYNLNNSARQINLQHKQAYHSIKAGIKKNSKLVDYVAQCKNFGLSDNEIVERCSKVGWKREEIKEAFIRR